LIVTATDDLGRTSTLERDFTLDLTLGWPTTIAPALTVPRATARPVASFALTRRARVTTRVETTSGVLVRKLGTAFAGPGRLSVAWDGKASSGASVYSGRYVVRATAVSPVGTSDLGATVTVRRRASK
jgi:hypothetical protein